MTAAGAIHVRTEDRVAWITLDRAPLNVIDIPMMHALGKALDEIAGLCDFVVFRGAGPKGFSAGVDVADHTPECIHEMLSTFHGIFRGLWRADFVTIAAVHNYCLGGGCELAAFCDFVVAGESAFFGQPEIRLGCYPPVAMVLYPALVGPRAAMHLLLTGHSFSAREAYEMGLVTRVVPDDDLDREVQTLLSELRASSPLVLRMVRRALLKDSGLDFEKRLIEVERTYLDELMKTSDAAEGIRAFIEKRAPVWKGR